MSIETKKVIIAVVSLFFLASLLLVQWKEISRQQVESGHANPHIAVPESSKRCVECHARQTPSVVSTGKKAPTPSRGSPVWSAIAPTKRMRILSCTRDSGSPPLSLPWTVPDAIPKSSKSLRSPITPKEGTFWRPWTIFWRRRWRVPASPSTPTPRPRR